MADRRHLLACAACAKAKARCVQGPEGAEKCERCHRLDKDCVARMPGPPRPRHATRRSLLSQLEQRLRDLEDVKATAEKATAEEAADASSTPRTTTGPHGLSITRGNGPPIINGPLIGHLFSWDNTTSEWPTKETVRAASASASASGASASPASMAGTSTAATPMAKPMAPTPMASTPTAPTPMASEKAPPPPWKSVWPDSEEAEVLLQIYLRDMAHLFPFAVLPMDIKAADMKLSRPFLYRAVMMAACMLDGARHTRMGHELLADIVKATMMEAARGLDILQGMQALIAWYHFKSPVLMNLLFLARSMCLGLGLGGQALPQTQNLDHLRAYAGTYYLNTLALTTNKNTEVLMNTSFLESSCNILEAASEYESDEYLVKLVRVQLLAQSISLTLAHGPGSQPSMQLLPVTIVVGSFQEQINALRQSLGPELTTNHILQTHLFIAEVLLTEWATSDRLCNDSALPLTDRLRLLWSCVSALKELFAIRMRIWSTGCEKPDFLVTHGSELAYALLTCVRIVTLRLPGWNLEHIERELGFSQIMDAVIAHFMRLAEIRREGPFTAALLQHRQQQKSSGGAASNNESLESQGDVRQTPGDTPTLDNGPQADEEEDTVVGVIRLCVSMRSRIRVEMARAQAECKAEGQSMANLDQVPQYQQQPQDAAAMTGLTPAPDTLLAGITGNEAMMNAGADPILQAYEYMSDAVWSGTGTMDDFLMY